MGYSLNHIDYSHITAAWAMFLSTWVIVYFSVNYAGLNNWKNLNDILRVELVMGLITMLFVLLRLNFDYFFQMTKYKLNKILAVVFSFICFSSFTVYMGIVADRTKAVNTHAYWFGWIGVVLYFASTILSFMKPSPRRLSLNAHSWLNGVPLGWSSFSKIPTK